MRPAGLLCLLLAVGCRAGGDNAVDVVGDAEPLRIVTLAPHLAELVFAAGAGSQLVGVSSYSDFPEAVRTLPVVGDAFRVDRERLALLDADLLLAWESGTPAHIVDSLSAGGHRVELIRTRNLSDISIALHRIGALTKSEDSARMAAEAFEKKLTQLALRWQDAESIRVFYQVSLRPLYSINGDHYISELISLCGGKNIFADLSDLAPMISEEAVLDRNPEVMLAADTGGESTAAQWGYWDGLAANQYASHFVIPADAVARPTPRVIEAGEAICAALQEGRERRARTARLRSLAGGPR